MPLTLIDWLIVLLFISVSLGIGIMVSRRAGRDTSEFFLSGRRMPWWLLGVSMVATTFSTDTPHLVTDIVRTHGVAGNWVWWAFLLNGMLTAFVYARLWRRSEAMTDIEFYELRYSGRLAAVLRGFRVLYLSLFFVVSMAAVTLAAIKIGGVLMGLQPWQTVVIGGGITVAYSMLGGLRGVLYTDFIQFVFAMGGAFLAAWVALSHPEIRSLTNLLAHDEVMPKLSLFPAFSDTELFWTVLVIPLAIQWWSVWYPGSEPGGGGHIVQRMLSARNEQHALGASFFFNCAHYALRPWPWILVALCSLVVFPDLDSLQRAFPHIDDRQLGHDLAYPAMLTFLPNGLRGLVAASLVAAYMSTLSTQFNLVSSYLVNDFYRRFVNPQASERDLVRVGRLCTVGVMILAGLLALSLSHALQAFRILLQIGAGTGLLFLLRWFWWRVNAASELTAMVVSFGVAMYFQFGHSWTGLVPLTASQQLVTGVFITTVCWVGITLLTPPADTLTLRRFYRLVRPGGPGWARVREAARADGDPVDTADQRRWPVPYGLLCMAVGCVAVYGTLFATGYWIYGNKLPALTLTLLALFSTILLIRLWRGLPEDVHGD